MWDNNIFEFSFNISTITKIEVLGWNKITDKIKTKTEKFIYHANIYYIDKAIEEKAVKIKQLHKIPIPYAVIASNSFRK